MFIADTSSQDCNLNSNLGLLMKLQMKTYIVPMAESNWIG